MGNLAATAHHFPAPAGPPTPWQRRLLLGSLVAILGGDALGQALGFSTFEGGRGYFVAFLLVPATALLGALIGALIGGRIRRSISWRPGLRRRPNRAA